MAFGIDDAAMLAVSAGSTLAGLFGRDTNNPLDFLKDPNNPFYKVATQNFYKNLSKTLSANTAGRADLLAMQVAQGGGYGGSTYIAGKQRENIEAKNRDVAGNVAGQFENNLFTEGMKLYAGGEQMKYENTNSFANQLMTLGGGLFSRYFNKGGGDNKVLPEPFDKDLPYNGFPPITF